MSYRCVRPSNPRIVLFRCLVLIVAHKPWVGCVAMICKKIMLPTFVDYKSSTSHLFQTLCELYKLPTQCKSIDSMIVSFQLSNKRSNHQHSNQPSSKWAQGLRQDSGSRLLQLRWARISRCSLRPSSRRILRSIPTLWVSNWVKTQVTKNN